jgi:hypothetical protein
VIEWLPVEKGVVVVKVAVSVVASSVTVELPARAVPPSSNVTLPEGINVPLKSGVTLAVKVTVWSALTCELINAEHAVVLCSSHNNVVVLVMATEYGEVPGLPTKLLSPE